MYPSGLRSRITRTYAAVIGFSGVEAGWTISEALLISWILGYSNIACSVYGSALARGSPKRGNGAFIVNWWMARRAQFLSRRAFKALNLDLELRWHCLFDSTRDGSTLFHDTWTGVTDLN